MAIQKHISTNDYFDKVFWKGFLESCSHDIKAICQLWWVELKVDGQPGVFIKSPVSVNAVMDGTMTAANKKILAGRILSALAEKGVAFPGGAPNLGHNQTLLEKANEVYDQVLAKHSKGSVLAQTIAALEKGHTVELPAVTGHMSSGKNSPFMKPGSWVVGKSKISDVLDQALVAKVAPATKKPANLAGTVPLLDAQDIGQKVQGTSAGSVYRAIAISPQVKLAARVLNGNLSLRLEGTVTPEEASALKALGFDNNGKHYSTHFGLEGVLACRAIGAVLMSLPITFEKKVSSLKEVLHALA